MRISTGGYGWLPDLPDHRDHPYSTPTETLTSLPSKVDLRSRCPPVYDEGQLGSNTASTIAAAIEFCLMKQKTKVFTPSRLFIYYNERVIERTVESDAGAQIRDGIKCVAIQGYCSEEAWPYDISKYAVKPPQKCYDEATKHKALKYQRIERTLDQMNGCLASGFPFIFGFSVYGSFLTPEMAQTGNAHTPTPEEQIIGGHAVLAVGYDDSRNWFIIRNSWGSSWGMNGYFTLPYSYLLDQNLSDDFWTIQLVT
jgi:C1A family cysteine protease